MVNRISNIEELAAALMPTMEVMVAKMANRVYQTLNYFLQSYYNSYDPTSYRRQYDFLKSAVKVEPRRVGNRVVASVYIDYDSMDSYYNATGLQVAEWANQGLHGGLALGDNTPYVWDATMRETIDNGELLILAIEYLKRNGIEVKR